MCNEHSSIPRVRLHRCHHGAMHLNLGAITLHLTLGEFQMLAAAIDRWYRLHPGEIPDPSFFHDTNDGFNLNSHEE